MQRVIVGLGNPGTQYNNNRHNIGFMAVDAIAQKYSTGEFAEKFGILYAKTRIKDKDVVLIKPMTYMNNSGIPVAKFTAFFKIDPSKVIVIHDDMDLATGRVKFKHAGGHGGHNGLKSLDSHIGKNYYRLRLGIAHPGDSSKVNSHVLSDFNSDELGIIKQTISFVIDKIDAIMCLDTANVNNLAGQYYKNIIKEE